MKLIHQTASVILTTIYLTSCVQNPTTQGTKVDPWQLTGKPPTRLCLLIVEGITPEVIASQHLNHFKRLAQIGISFPAGFRGTPLANRLQENAIVVSGRLPNHLPWPDRNNDEALTQFLTLDPTHWLTRRVAPNDAVAIGPSLGQAQSLGGATTRVWNPKPVELPLPIPAPTVDIGPLAPYLEGREPWKAIAVRGTVGEVPSATTVDSWLGGILDALETKNWAKDTLLIVVSLPPDEEPTTPPPPRLKSALIDHQWEGNLSRYWLRGNGSVGAVKLAALIKSRGDVSEIYTKQNTGQAYHYIRAYRSSKRPESPWGKGHHLAIMESIASKDSADVIAVRFAKHQNSLEKKQIAPLYLWSPNLKQAGVVSESEPRLVDIDAIASRIMHLSGDTGEDSDSHVIDPWVSER